MWERFPEADAKMGRVQRRQSHLRVGVEAPVGMHGDRCGTLRIRDALVLKGLLRRENGRRCRAVALGPQ